MDCTEFIVFGTFGSNGSNRGPRSLYLVQLTSRKRLARSHQAAWQDVTPNFFA
ncbi:MAG UNVERIFIED_CONTAM: hypothetical protein LVR29_25400 [Microcystis novacekii LVE1205-3]